MRRPCSYCGAELIVSEDQILPTFGWAFVKCPQCAEGSVVRSARPAARPSFRVKLPEPKPADPPAVIPPPMVLMPELPRGLAPTLPIPKPAPQPPVFRAKEPVVEAVPPPKAEIPLPLPELDPRPAHVRSFGSFPKITPGHIDAWMGHSRKLAFIIGLGTTVFIMVQLNRVREIKQSLRDDVVRTSMAHSAPAPAPAAIPAEPARVVRAEVPSAPADASVAVPAAAPAAPEVNEVRVTADTAILRSGPGQKYRRIGIAHADLRLNVLQARQDWLEVEPAVDSTAGEKRRAWIRQDLVGPLSGGG